MWHYHLGDGLRLDATSRLEGKIEETVIGHDLAAGQKLQHAVSAGTWFGAERPEGAGFCLVGCTVAPGFDFADFELGKRLALVEEFPLAREAIVRAHAGIRLLLARRRFEFPGAGASGALVVGVDRVAVADADEGGSGAPQQSVELLFRRRVHRARRLVEEDVARPRDQEAREDALLPPRESTCAQSFTAAKPPCARAKPGRLTASSTSCRASSERGLRAAG